jgi:DNA-binding IclR family transcriptional regulator
MSSLENGLAILGLLSPARRCLRVGEVGRDLGLPKASISRLLRDLAESGLLEREPDGPGYVAGPRAMLLGNQYLARHTLVALVDSALDDLVAQFGFTGFASVLSGREIVLVGVKQGSYPLRYVRELGSALPSWRTTMGAALLSRLTEAALRERFSDPAQAIDVEALLARLAPLRTERIFTGISELTPGIVTISTVVGDAHRANLTALAMAFPENAADKALRHRMEAAILERAESISASSLEPT